MCTTALISISSTLLKQVSLFSPLHYILVHSAERFQNVRFSQKTSKLEDACYHALQMQ